MSVFVWGIILFLSASLSHIIIWRIRKPANPIKALILLYAFFLIAGIILAAYFSASFPDSPLFPRQLIQYAYISIFFLSLFFAYLLTYSAIEADSPSLVITLEIVKAGKEGLAAARLQSLSGDDILVFPRIKDLVDSGLIKTVKDRYIIDRGGEFFILPFVFFRNFLGLGKGG